jgi:hypothetical protein
MNGQGNPIREQQHSPFQRKGIHIMKAATRLLSALLIILFIASQALAATVKKKNGQLVKGEITGRIVQKGKTEKIESRYKYSDVFNVIEGKGIDTIDERGVNPIKGTTFSIILYYYSDETPPEDTWVLDLAEGFLAMGSDVSMNIKGDLLGIKRAEGKNLIDPLLGELVREEKTVRVLPALKVKTDKGMVEIPISDVARFGGVTQRPSQTKK